MARFIVLKNGANYSVFDFNGNIARIGSGATEDLRLDDTGIDGDIFFLSRTGSGYEIEKRSDQIMFAVNGETVAQRAALKDGDKITFLNYLIIVKYQEQSASSAGSEPIQPRPSPKETAPPTPANSEKSITTESKPKPAARGSEKPTQFLNYADLESQRESSPSQKSIPAATEKPPVRSATDPVIARQQPVIEQPKPESKKKITPVYSLVGLCGQHKGKTIFIDAPEFVVGREKSSDLAIERDESGQLVTDVSRLHFIIHSTDDGLYLTDKKSQLRTYINRKVIEPDQREYIAPEDLISIPAPSGEIIFRLCFAGQENFAPVGGKSNVTKMILVLAGVILLLIILWIWLL